MSKFKVGDRVRCVDTSYAGEFLTRGDEFEVTGVNDELIELIYIRDLGWWRADRFELVEDKVREFKAGDRVRCIDSSGVSTAAVSRGSLRHGEEYTVKRVVLGGGLLLEGDCTWWIPGRFELVKDEVKEELPPMWHDMTEEERTPIAMAFARGEEVQYWSGEYWQPALSLTTLRRHRIKPEEPIADSIDWSHVSSDYNYMACDKDGCVWLCDALPELGIDAWHYSKELVKAHAFASYKQGNLPWDQSLICRPGFE